MTHLKVVTRLASPAFLTLRGAVVGPVMLACAILTVACSGRTNPERFGAATRLDSDTPSADDAGGPVDGDGGLYGPCIGHNDFTSGSCAGDAVCGSFPDVGYTYCMPRAPCAAGMVPVLNIACVYPCDDASDCYEHGLAKCAVATLPNFTGGPPAWCTP